MITPRETVDLILDTVAQVERGRAEVFAALPTEAERVALVCKTVAEVERARAEWLEGFVAGGG